MTSIRTPWWAAAALSLPLAVFAVGCAEEPAAPEPTPTPAPSVAPSPSPIAKPEAPKAEAPAPAPKTEAPKAEAPAPKAEAPKLEPPKIDVPKPEAPKGDAAKKAAAKVEFSEEELAAIKKLPAGEVDAALEQGLCPVSGEHLGAMEMPVKATAEGKTFYVCCEGCLKEVKEHPKDVLAKLPK